MHKDHKELKVQQVHKVFKVQLEQQALQVSKEVKDQAVLKDHKVA